MPIEPDNSVECLNLDLKSLPQVQSIDIITLQPSKWYALLSNNTAAHGIKLLYHVLPQICVGLESESEY